MDDKQMLELAAKAAGINFHHVDDAGVWWSNGHMDARVRKWNPLEDDGDALRLAAALHISVIQDEAQRTATSYETYTFSVSVTEAWGSDARSATRRAIVRAAAAIGEKNCRT